MFLFPEIHGKNCSSLPGLQQHAALFNLTSLSTGEKTVNWKIMYDSLKDLGVDCFSALCQGGNQPLKEFLDVNHTSMKFCTAFSDIQGY